MNNILSKHKVEEINPLTNEKKTNWSLTYWGMYDSPGVPHPELEKPVAEIGRQYEQFEKEALAASAKKAGVPIPKKPTPAQKAAIKRLFEQSLSFNYNPQAAK
jgi:hypothetical protein